MRSTELLAKAIENLDAARPLIAQGCLAGASALADRAAFYLRLAGPWVDPSAYRHAVAAAELCSELVAALDARRDASDLLSRTAAAVMECVNQEQRAAVGSLAGEEAEEGVEDAA